MKQIGYSGSFLSRSGVTWTVELFNESPAVAVMATTEGKAGELDFEAEEALVIEWGSTEKYEVLQGSTATIRIDSPGDRTYQGLYSVAAGDIRMDVRRNGKLYWSGTLDPEFYEEPYERKNHYTVSLTFSDFGILDRKCYNKQGYVTIRNIITYCLDAAGINYGSIITHISTKVGDKDIMGVSVRSDNFYDEDGEAMTLREVLEGVMQPLGLRMIQRNGNVEIYDLNALAGTTASKTVVWCGDSSLMSVDRVYNNAKITWSTYAVSGNMNSDNCYVQGIDKNVSALNMLDGLDHNGSTVYTYHYSGDWKKWNDPKDYGFSIWTSPFGVNAIIRNAAAKFYKIVPQYDGAASEGIALYWKAVSMNVDNNLGQPIGYHEKMHGMSLSELQGGITSVGGVIFQTSTMEIPSVPSAEALQIRISMNLLFDPRFNPFEVAVNILESQSAPKGYHAQKDYQQQYQEQANFLYVPVKIKFRPSGSEKEYCWTNQSVVRQPISQPATLLDETLGEWVEDQPSAFGYLCYYNPSDRAENSGIGQGFAMNHQGINPHTQVISSVVENMGDGQLIPYPSLGRGEIWMEVLDSGWILADGDTDLSTSDNNPAKIWGDENGMNKINWILAQLPEIEIANNQQFDAAISTDDVEYNSTLNPAAKESLELDTICGTKEGGVPTARGAYYDGTTQITEFARAGRTAQVEELLLGTLYSQYAERHTTLSGEVEILTGGLSSYLEDNQNGVFMLSSDVQDVIADTSDATFVEVSVDEYSKKK